MTIEEIYYKSGNATAGKRFQYPQLGITYINIVVSGSANQAGSPVSVIPGRGSTLNTHSTCHHPYNI